jgi:hypothetical protein
VTKGGPQMSEPENQLERTEDILTWQQEIARGRFRSTDDERTILVACITEMEVFEQAEQRPFDTGRFTLDELRRRLEDVEARIAEGGS